MSVGTPAGIFGRSGLRYQTTSTESALIDQYSLPMRDTWRPFPAESVMVMLDGKSEGVRRSKLIPSDSKCGVTQSTWGSKRSVMIKSIGPLAGGALDSYGRKRAVEPS